MQTSGQYAYVFVRQDLPIAQQIVQSNHATLSMASLYDFEGTPNIVVIGVEDKEELMSVARLCSDWAIPHYLWTEPDFDFGETAITTAAISGHQREAFTKFSTWKQAIHASPSGLAADSNSAHAGSNPAA